MATIWDRFDSKVALCYVKTPQKTERLKQELQRVNLTADIQYNYDTIFYDIIYDRCPSDRKTKGIKSDRRYFYATMNHYRAVKIAYQLNKQSILVLEDDCRFLNDISLLSNIVNAIPYNFDLALFDSLYFLKGNEIDIWKTQYRFNQYWSGFGNLRSAACYALSRRGMERIINLHESFSHCSKYKMRIFDQWFKANHFAGLNLYMAIPNAAIQQNTGLQTNTNYNSLLKRYIRQNIDISQYAPF